VTRLPTHLWVSAHLRTANLQGIPVVVARRGDRERGTVILKLNRLEHGCTVLVQVRQDGGDDLVWSRATGPEPVAEAEADRYIERQVRFDPDVWVIEVEDRQGRSVFEGKIIG